MTIRIAIKSIRTGCKGVQQWAERQPGLTPEKKEPGKSTSGTAALGFASAASRVLKRRKAGLIRRLEQLLAVEVHGQRAQRLFSEVAAYYLAQHQDKASIVSETCRLKSVPTIGHLPIHHVHDGTLAPHVEMRLDAGRSHKTVNPELAIVRRILNLCATRWRDDVGNTWLEQAPRITLLPLTGHQRELRPPGDVAARTRGGAARRDASPPKVPGQRKTG